MILCFLRAFFWWSILCPAASMRRGTVLWADFACKSQFHNSVPMSVLQLTSTFQEALTWFQKPDMEMN